ncbi:hypothetical protein vseg_018116 [Gypsophila vaccaria]
MLMNITGKYTSILAVKLPLIHHHHGFYRVKCCANNSTDNKFSFKIPPQLQNFQWNFPEIDHGAVKKSLNSLLSRTHNFVNEVTAPLVKTAKPDSSNDDVSYDAEDIYVGEQTIKSEMPSGKLSLAAIASIEQFSRMNGLTGQQMQKVFQTLVPQSVYKDVRNLVEYCCFRYLSRDYSDIHPCLQDLAFQRLIFITMLGWENPYRQMDWSRNGFEEASLKTRLVGEEAFVRLAPAVSGVADRATVHNLYKALAGSKGGISFNIWSSYIHGLLKVHNERKSFRIQELPQLLSDSERVLCVGTNRKQPVLKWDNNIALPGKLILTDRALYFEPVDWSKNKKVMRLDITGHGAQVKKTKVGLFGAMLFDSAVSISSGGKESETWVLEFIDLGGEMRRDVWHASISEVIALHKFILEYGPKEDDNSVSWVYGADKGKKRANIDAISSISRLQSLQSIRKLLDDPIKLVQFSYLLSAPFGDIVSQTLALSYWGGPLVSKSREARNHSIQKTRSQDEASSVNNLVHDIDGSVYMKQWTRSPSWASKDSIAFWRNAALKHGFVLSKNLVVGGTSLVERAATVCRDKYKAVEKTQATINAATLEGIPSNIDLFKELLLPLMIMAGNFDKLRRWEDPFLTISFLAFSYSIIFRNLLAYVLPATLVMAAAAMLSIKALKEQGRLGRSFGKVTIRDQPPSNTIQKILALKEAMRDMENYLQNLNVTLLKLRTIILAGQPQITNEVALVLLSCATVLLIFPFKYVLAFFVFDVFTRELEFRRAMVVRFRKMLKDRWETVPAAPVIVLPFENVNKGLAHQTQETTKLEGQENLK